MKEWNFIEPYQVLNATHKLKNLNDKALLYSKID